MSWEEMLKIIHTLVISLNLIYGFHIGTKLEFINEMDSVRF